MRDDGIRFLSCQVVLGGVLLEKVFAFGAHACEVRVVGGGAALDVHEAEQYRSPNLDSSVDATKIVKVLWLS